MSEGTKAEREITITRVFDAPRELVWKAWTDPEQFSRWWGPRGLHTPLETVEMDVRPGGVFRATMVMDDGSGEFPSNGVFREVEEPERLVFAEEDPDHPDIDGMRTEVTFKDLGDGRTEVNVSSMMITTEDFPEQAKAGWTSSFEKLDELLA